MAGIDIGIDLGTSSVIVYVSGKGIVLREPSVLAIDKRLNSIIAVGTEAKRMIGKTHEYIETVKPLRNGVINDYFSTELMLKSFVEKISEKKGMGRVVMPRIMVCVPSGVTPVEKKAVEGATKQSGAREVFMIEEPIAAAIGSGIDIGHPGGHMIVDIGGGTTDIAVISLGGSVVSQSIKMGGDKFDEAIIKYVKKKYNILIGEITAERIKLEVGTTIPVEEERTVRVSGRNLANGLPQSITISAEEAMEALEECVKEILSAVVSVLNVTPPELASDISENGILLSGGGSLLYGMDKRIQAATKIVTRRSDDPVNCVAKGTGMALGFLDVLENGGAFTKGE